MFLGLVEAGWQNRQSRPQCRGPWVPRPETAFRFGGEGALSGPDPGQTEPDPLPGRWPAGLYGTDEREAALVDMVNDGLEDLRRRLAASSTTSV